MAKTISSKEIKFTGDENRPIRLLEKTDYRYLVSDMPWNYPFETAVLCNKIEVCFGNNWVNRDSETFLFNYAGRTNDNGYVYQQGHPLSQLMHFDLT